MPTFEDNVKFINNLKYYLKLIIVLTLKSGITHHFFITQFSNRVPGKNIINAHKQGELQT